VNNAVVTHPATFINPATLCWSVPSWWMHAAHAAVALPQAGRAGDDASRSARPPHGVRQTPGNAAARDQHRRLDLNSEGLLLLTNDGPWRAGWSCPRRVATPLPRAGARFHRACLARRLAKGVEIDACATARSSRARLTRRERLATVSLREVRNREVRRVMRISVGGDTADPHRLWPVQLGALPRGAVEEVPAACCATVAAPG